MISWSLQDFDTLSVYVAAFVSHPPAQVMFKRVERCAPRLATAPRSPLRTPLRPARPSAAAAGGVLRPRCDRRDRWSRPTRVRDPGVTGPRGPASLFAYRRRGRRRDPEGGRDAGGARVRGEAPPGWTISGPGAVVKDPAAWNGPDLTAAARAAYAQFIRRLSLMAHSNYPVTIDEITGSAPVDPRRPLPRPVWSGRGK